MGSELQLRTAVGFDIEPTQPVEFELTVVNLSQIARSGVGAIECLDVDRPDLDVALGGTGEIKLEGTVTEQHVVLDGTGRYQAAQLVSTNATIVLLGVGDAFVRVSGTLDATVSGLGTVYYYGSPTTIEDHGGGGVEPGP